MGGGAADAPRPRLSVQSLLIGVLDDQIVEPAK
jgi:hypothetical protein